MCRFYCRKGRGIRKERQAVRNSAGQPEQDGGSVYWRVWLLRRQEGSGTRVRPSSTLDKCVIWKLDTKCVSVVSGETDLAHAKHGENKIPVYFYCGPFYRWNTQIEEESRL